ncbi:PHD finger protein 14 isoform X4 [Tribolium castaneum]|uniref:PHD finger protein 14 isoform X4 n=1 Tax=Tribolium castaneum TaxID=7070 RepID=UPI00046C2BC0|nr:PREDICTED: PHD finger protein 14 isoform X4 [Tribolium castaneum]|eukprot:XP_008194450.1 PREDICTED: PHD finger protein 14 isoform X4 [Tribolium castaneum]
MPNLLERAEDIDFVTKTAIERDPNKRRVKPVETQASILDFDLEEESSDDSDFRIEDHPEVSDDDDSGNSASGGNDSSGEEESEGSDLDELKNLNLPNGDGLSIADVIQQANLQLSSFNEKDAQILICCGCLGDQSDGVNEIVECDSCGVTVHEACYGVADSASLSSTDSLSPTAPWFCEACKAGVMNPVCELCPNSGGIFKETDVGKWIHLVCALYVPGVAFGEVDKLTSVTLFEMPYSKWGAKSCSLCQDERFARTGVCIGCDAGMCKTYFHVTCAQREGFLSEAHSEEVDQADPFYAHCKLHSDKTLVKRRRKNYLALQLRTHYRKLQFEKEGHSETPEQVRIQRKLEKQKLHFLNHKALKPPPWVPTQKMPRLLTTSASACRKLLRKAELMGINTMVLEMQEAQAAALVDVRKKWHIPPAFTVEFIAYYLDRNDRLKGMKQTLEKLLEDNRDLLEEQQLLRTKYDEILKKSADETKKNIDLKQTIHKYHSAILSACPTKNLPNIEDLAALKMGVGFPLNNIIPAGRTDRVLSSHAKQDSLMLNECGICRQKRDQHLLAKCDTCHLYYHLNCLNPPLTRLPKKSKLYGWQCSECDKTSDSEVEEVKTPRRSKSRYSREARSDPEVSTPKLKIKPVEPVSEPTPTPTPTPEIVPIQTSHSEVVSEMNGFQSLDGSSKIHVSKSGKKRRREKHKNRYSPDLGAPSKEHKRKRKKKSLDFDDHMPHPRITIKIKPIPLPAGEVASESNPQCFYVPNENNDNAPPPISLKVISLPEEMSPKDIEKNPVSDICDVCHTATVASTSVRCDDCQKTYHFTCLDPPLKKSPKKRGYSWHCADCDPTGSE